MHLPEVVQTANGAASRGNNRDLDHVVTAAQEGTAGQRGSRAPQAPTMANMRKMKKKFIKFGARQVEKQFQVGAARQKDGSEPVEDEALRGQDSAEKPRRGANAAPGAQAVLQSARAAREPTERLQGDSKKDEKRPQHASQGHQGLSNDSHMKMAPAAVEGKRFSLRKLSHADGRDERGPFMQPSSSSQSPRKRVLIHRRFQMARNNLGKGQYAVTRPPSIPAPPSRPQVQSHKQLMPPIAADQSIKASQQAYSHGQIQRADGKSRDELAQVKPNSDSQSNKASARLQSVSQKKQRPLEYALLAKKVQPSPFKAKRPTVVASADPPQGAPTQASWRQHRYQSQPRSIAKLPPCLAESTSMAGPSKPQSPPEASPRQSETGNDSSDLVVNLQSQLIR